MNAITSNAPMLIQSAVDITAALVKGLIQAIPQLIKAVPQMMTAFAKAFGAVSGQLLEIGGNLVRGIWQGISNGYGWITARITEWVGNVVAFFKKAFKIKSPSGVMREEIGKYLAMGVGEGLTKYAGYATSAMAELMSGIMGEAYNPTIDATVNGSSGLYGAALAGAGGMSGVTIGAVNFNQPLQSTTQAAKLFARKLTGELYA